MLIEELFENVSRAVQRELPFVPPELDLKVSFHRKKQQRATKKSAPVDKYFHPERGDEILITFVKRAAGEDPTPGRPVDAEPEAASAPAASAGRPAEPPLQARVLRALHKAETDRRVNFVAFKWFRDTILPGEGLAPEEARRELNAAIEAGMIHVTKLANPNSPYPTSTLRLEHGHEAVKAALHQPGQPPRKGFVPVSLDGVKLSEVILAGRR